MIEAGRRHNRGLPMAVIDQTEMWQIGKKVRETRKYTPHPRRLEITLRS